MKKVCNWYPFDDDDDLNDVLCITTIGSDNEICCQIGGVQAKAIIDSGSKCNLIDESTWQNMKKSNVKVTNKKRESDRSFRAYGGQALTVLGTFDAVLQIKNKKVTARFYIIKGKGKLLIGRGTANTLGILKIDFDVNKIDDSEQEFAKMKGITVEIPIRSNVKPVVQPYRRIPIPVEKAVDDQINTLLKQGIIEAVKGPSKWISPLVIVPKQNSKDIRICVDMRRANEAIDRENHPLPTFDDFLPHLAKAKWYSKIDIKNAFHQVNK